MPVSGTGAVILAATLGSMGDGMENIIINHVFRSASTTGSNCFLALYKSSPAETDIAGNEVANLYGYSRIDISGSFIVDKTGGSAINDHNLIFPVASGSWGNILYWAIRNGSGLGNSGSLLFWGPVAGFDTYDWGRYVDEGERITFPSGSLKIKITGSYITPLLSGSLLGHYLNNVTFATGSKIFMGLYRDAPPNFLLGGGGATSGSTEISGSVTYERKSVGWSGSWRAPSAGSTVNALRMIVSYGIDDTKQEWGYVKGAFFTTSASGGETLFYAPFVTSKYVGVGNGFIIASGLLKIALD